MRHAPLTTAEPGRRSQPHADDGIEAIEYALFLALLVGVIAAVVLPQFGTDLANAYTAIVSTLSAAISN